MAGPGSLAAASLGWFSHLFFEEELWMGGWRFEGSPVRESGRGYSELSGLDGSGY
jgi:hypothetical protein